MATLDSIEASLDALCASVDRRFDAQDRALNDIKRQLELLNGRTREAERCIAVLQEQQRTRMAGLVSLQVLIGAVAAWLGMRTP
jgi:chromosome segregation ATPase